MSGDVELTKPLYREGLRIAQRIGRPDLPDALPRRARLSRATRGRRASLHTCSAPPRPCDRNLEAGSSPPWLRSPPWRRSRRGPRWAPTATRGVRDGRRRAGRRRDAPPRHQVLIRLLPLTSPLPPRLGRREPIVARLVADGLSNKQIRGPPVHPPSAPWRATSATSSTSSVSASPRPRSPQWVLVASANMQLSLATIESVVPAMCRRGSCVRPRMEPGLAG